MADNLLLGVAYFATAKLGLLLAVPHPNVTPIWPAAGIALAAVLVYGYRLLPGAALGAFLVNATTAVPLGVAAGIAAGNTLETFLGVFLLRHVVDFRVSLTRVKDILGLFGLAAFGATVVAATLGT